MKKKTIEKIPFLTLPAVHRGKTVKYVAVTDIREIGDEPHLFIEVYRNRNDSRNIPAVRIVLTKKDFGSFFPGTGKWTRQRITESTWSSYGMIWQDAGDRRAQEYERTKKENAMHSAADEKRMRGFLEDVTGGNMQEVKQYAWWNYVKCIQDRIAREECNARWLGRMERRTAALEDRIKNTGMLPEGRIRQYADQAVFGTRHTIFYRKHGTRATVACTNCGSVTEARWRQGQSWQSKFERQVTEPVEKHYGICPMCRETGIFIPQGRAGRMRAQKGHLFLGQRYKESGFVLRYVVAEKEWVLEEAGENGQEMERAYENLSVTEVARIYFEPGKKVQKDYRKYNPCRGEAFWDDCNLSGLANIVIRTGKIMPETFLEIKGTFLRYSALEEYSLEEHGCINPVDYLERYIQTRQIEILVKMGLTEAVRELVKCHYGIVWDPDAKTPARFLGIRKERVKQLVRAKGNTDMLEVMQMEQRMHQHWTERQIWQMAEIGCRVCGGLAYMGVQKFLNRVAKYAGCDYGTRCRTAVSRLRYTAGRYSDYLDMRHELGYDMTNTVYLFPRDLDAAHAEMVEENDKKEADIRTASVCAKYPLIRKHYRRYRKQFYFADGELLIRPARDAGEIVTEGRVLHHCVGKNTYLEKHNEGKSIILFLRAKADPDMPYITVEIDPGKKTIMQWYGAYDKKPDRKRIQKWLDAYVIRLECRQEAAGQDGAREAGQGLLMAAM